jgi:hypothetical protein
VVRNREIRVIEDRAQPVSRGVAGIARRWIAGSNVVRHSSAQSLRAVPLCQVAPIAGGVRRSQPIVVTHVAIGAGLNPASGWHDVPAGKCPTGGAVIELAV